ncbi:MULTISPECIES: tyrosine-type recombinase/integrase [Paraburkholderia]|uniref:Site-specific integrase n=1 Tax=Paraburkholderia podalyriae TaxID=1938811 RepID=A0ABR7PYQ5_9BURK|nr:tyrosine-type recombinase/integrase [Paraburkholderia podalyriae]MBC8751427.1 site-specific integrase [Paraburkholderia podalyriae]
MLNISRNLPEPTVRNPFVQVEYIFDRYCEDGNGERSTVNTLLKRYKVYLDQKFGVGRPLFLADVWNESALIDFSMWAKSQKAYKSGRPLGSGTQATMSYSLRGIIRYAYDERYINMLPFIAPMKSMGRETSVRNAYSQNEEMKILDAIGPEIRYAHRAMQPYIRTGAGSAPERRKPITKEQLTYVFENSLNCIPISATQLYLHYRKELDAAIRLYGSVDAWYRSLGVAEIVSSDLIMPFVYKLAWETGLNVESILSLRRDCFIAKHPLTAMPCIMYYKERSQGEASYPVELLEANLQSKQSSVVKNTINQILKLTSGLVESAEEEDKNMLLLVQVTRKQKGRGTRGAVSRLKVRHLTKWSRAFFTPSIKYTNPHNSDENINASRFRPTFVARLVLEGVDIFHISALLNHVNISTTYAYLDEHGLSPQFDMDMRKHLNQIKQNGRELRKTIPIVVASDAAPEEVYLASGLCHCKNPYNPPKKIRLASKFIPGKACTYYDMCLLCKNILITEYDLPKLINHRLNLQIELDKGVGAEPRKALYRKQLYVLNEVLAPDEFFTEDELQRAAILAKQSDFDHFDDFLYE